MLSSITKIAKQAASAATASLSRLANKQEFQAVIAACVLVANADGSTGQDERNATIALASAHPELQAFGATAIVEEFKACHELIGNDRDIALPALLERVGKITDPMARSRIISIATAIANADGSLSDVEKQMLEKIRAA